MTWFLAWPALFKVSAVFLLILLLSRFKLHLSFCLLIGGMALGLWMGLGPGDTVRAIVEGLLSGRTLSLGAIVTIILVLSRVMADCGQLDRIVSSFTRMVKNPRVVSVAMPALIGLLPMPGGALFSAPMVESACRGGKVNGELKTAVNYWFRHIWEYWWPLYPGVVLAVSLLEVPTWRFMVVQLPMTVVTVLAGAVFMLPKTPKEGFNPETAGRQAGPGEFLKEARPIMLIILVIPLVKLFEWASSMDLPALTTVYLGLFVCFAAVIIDNRIGWRPIRAAVFNKRIGPMILLILSIMGFQNVLIDSRAVAEIQTEMSRYGISPLLLVMFLPLLSGFITGIAIGFVGASFPLLVPLLADKAPLDFMIHACLAYTFGHMGQMLSPVHLCFLVTKDYFQASLTATYRYLLGPVILLLVMAMSLFGLTRFFID